MLWECALGPEYQLLFPGSILSINFKKNTSPVVTVGAASSGYPGVGIEVAMPVYELGMFYHVTPIPFGSDYSVHLQTA